METQCYKLTSQNNFTMNNTLWGEGTSHETSGDGGLCSAGWLHAYSTPLLAVLLNPIHADITTPKLWLAYGSGKSQNDNGLKLGFTKLTTKYEIALPVITTTQIVAFGILCAMEVYKEEDFITWAKTWLSGEDRSCSTAYDAAYAVKYAAKEAYFDGSYAACYAASYAARSAKYDAYDAIKYAAGSSASSASHAAYAGKDLDLADLAEKAMKY